MSASSTPPRALIIEEGKDYFLERDDILPYVLLRNLGHGHSGNVEEVQDLHTGAVFARKTISIPGRRYAGERRRIFDNEIKIIRSLAGHHHIIRVFATYVGQRQVGLILQPSANEGDLEDFLQRCRDEIDESKAQKSPQPDLVQARILKQAFGCLAGTLAFIHKQRIRHKDIKPRNILVNHGQVIYTDFGYSLDSSHSTRSTTAGRPDFLTRRYSAPEVLDHGSRNSRSDVFSLGCVFMEIFSVLSQVVDIDHERTFSEEVDNIHQHLSAAKMDPSFRFLAELCTSMTASNPMDRSTASEAFSIIQKNPGYLCRECQPKALVLKTVEKDTSQLALKPATVADTKSISQKKKTHSLTSPQLLDNGSTSSKSKPTKDEDTRPSSELVSRSTRAVASSKQPALPLGSSQRSNNHDFSIPSQTASIPTLIAWHDSGEGSLPRVTTSPWIWSAPHQDYYYVQHNAKGEGEALYHWYKQAPESQNHGLSKATPEVSAFPAQGASVDRRKCFPSHELILGTPERGWYERLDSSYRTRTDYEARSFFVEGRVFEILGATAQSVAWLPYDPLYEIVADNVQYSSTEVAQLRRFVTISADDGLVQACPVSTHWWMHIHSQGHPRQLAALCPERTRPKYFEHEYNAIMPDTFHIKIADQAPGAALVPKPNVPLESRINFGKTFYLEQNVKVKDIGRLIDENLEMLIAVWEEANCGSKHMLL